jgi:hypothetical protein
MLSAALAFLPSHAFAAMRFGEGDRESKNVEDGRAEGGHAICTVLWRLRSDDVVLRLYDKAREEFGTQGPVVCTQALRSAHSIREAFVLPALGKYEYRCEGTPCVLIGKVRFFPKSQDEDFTAVCRPPGKKEYRVHCE